MIGPPTGEDRQPLVVMLCTGNAARSVMAGALLERVGLPVRVATAGTHVVEHQPMSVRTRAALEDVGIRGVVHRSRQLGEDHLDDADLVVAMAAEHVRFVRRRHPEAAGRTATISWLVDNLAPGPERLDERVAALDLDEVDPGEQGEVDDPAGGDDQDYIHCARQLADLVKRLGPLLV